jgi:hypothetical protein
MTENGCYVIYALRTVALADGIEVEIRPVHSGILTGQRESLMGVRCG